MCNECITWVRSRAARESKNSGVLSALGMSEFCPHSKFALMALESSYRVRMMVQVDWDACLGGQGRRFSERRIGALARAQREISR